MVIKALPKTTMSEIKEKGNGFFLFLDRVLAHWVL